MDHDVVLTRKDGTTRHFHVYGRPTPDVGEVVRLPIDGRLIKARVGALHGAASSNTDNSGPVDHVDAAEFEGV
jgi:hypothetical protein